MQQVQTNKYYKDMKTKKRYSYTQINEYNHSITDKKEKLIYYIFFDKVTRDKKISCMFNKLLLSDLKKLNKEIDYYLSYAYYVEQIT